MKPKSKLLSLLLAICLVVGLMPTAAFAAGTDTGKAIQLVDSGTAANIGGGQADNIYFGTYQQSSDGSGGYNTDPIKWRVLENADGQLFLLSDQNLDVFQYHTDKCPYCKHNSIIVFEDTRGHVQAKCKVCGRETVFDVLSMRKLQLRKP